MRRFPGSLGVVSAISAMFLWMGCSVAPPEQPGTISFNVTDIPSNITRVVGRVDSDSVPLVPTTLGTDTTFDARGVISVLAGEYIVVVDAYEGTTKLYSGRDTVTVDAGETVSAVVPLVCINAGCLTGAIAAQGIFPIAESEDNGSIAACDTTSAARLWDVQRGSGVPAPYAYAGNGTISSASDTDYWCAFQMFSAVDSLVAFTVTGAGSGLDPVLTLYDGTGTPVATNDNGGGENPNDALLQYKLSVTGWYYIRVSAASTPTSPGRYSVFIYVGWPEGMP